MHPNAGPSRALGQCPNCSGMWDDNTDNDEDGVAIVFGLEGEGRCDGMFLEDVVEIVLEDVPAVGIVHVLMAMPLFVL